MVKVTHTTQSVFKSVFPKIQYMLSFNAQKRSLDTIKNKRIQQMTSPSL